jgi:hypothetical protein
MRGCGVQESVCCRDTETGAVERQAALQVQDRNWATINIREQRREREDSEEVTRVALMLHLILLI